ncbi:VOC family protein [Kibdelosporangium phytohabitans]|uniref:Glyoxalase n=1 Tax=Kibdelosporangium phytohabitans TaxID=860235 RepID=A0A0N9I0P6_9PSEU|nr:VOC family protein [Kibdelosporangium phytohabitans]ALG08236.1 glyoxalase [Kibdelosporangium phytohabitans]MBE1470758.1 catechol 2,3-dioxygenase-like lactoylglutathione lyase family enzyme [Kibdelosporangium phytohabitans]
MTNQQKARIDAIRTVGIPVSDQDRALEFYIGVLGFEKLMDAPIGQFGGRWIELSPPRSAVTVALTPARAEKFAGVDTGIRFTTEDASALHAQLSSHGVDVDELLRWPGVPPMFDFRDLDGNVLYVSESSAPGEEKTQ